MPDPTKDQLDEILEQHREWIRGLRTDHLIGTSDKETKQAIEAIIATEVAEAVRLARIDEMPEFLLWLATYKDWEYVKTPILIKAYEDYLALQPSQLEKEGK